ncbi:MAG TPA: hypothetical protein VFQ63_04400 [Patescibacteria group bacterium]|nr:hypothetical protein [Patescibacteria group bacterium]
MDQDVIEPKPQFSRLSNAVVSVFEKREPVNNEPKINVNRFLSEIATWYEKLRNAMDIREEEVVLKSAIERILKRRLILGGDGKRVAEPLLRELIWAHYFPNNSIPESTVGKITTVIDLYLSLRRHALDEGMGEREINEWMYMVLSCHIARVLSPNVEKNAMSNFMYHIMRDRLVIRDDSEDTKNVQIYLAVRRAFAKDDIAFLRFYLFQQIFGELTTENIDHVKRVFIKGYEEIERQLNYPLKEKIYIYTKRVTPVFFILEDVLRKEKHNFRKLLDTPDEFKKEVFDACNIRYKGIRKRVTTAIIRSVVFLIITKAVIALGIEGTYEKWRYGHIMYGTIALNTGIPPVLMIIVSLFIKTPKDDNSERILEKINAVLYEEDPQITPVKTLMLNPPKTRTVLGTVFTLLGLAAFFISFGLMIYILNKLHFNIVSQGIFVFFITIVSFLAYRINLTAHQYTVEAKQGLLTPFVDFLIIPIVRVGMRLTEGISQINIIIFIFDFLIEAPFKAIFGFFEQFFSYLHASREELG